MSVSYVLQDEKLRSTTETSCTLEEKYLSDRRAEVRVMKGYREYIISFKGTTSCHLHLRRNCVLMKWSG